MGRYAIGDAVCNNCIHWQCHSERKFQGNPPREVYTTSNCDRCRLTKRTTLSSSSCEMFTHIGGISAQSFPVASPSRTSYNPRATFLSSVLSFVRESRAIDQAYDMARPAIEDEAQKRSHQRAAELEDWPYWQLVKHGMRPSASSEDRVSFRVLLENAAKGEAEAQCYLAYSFWRGEHGARKDHERAARWCWKAACQDYATAENLMGRFYHDGIGVLRNLEKAAAMFLRAAQRGSAEAIDNYRITRRELDE